MAETLSGTPAISRFTLGLINIATEVVLPPKANTVTVRFEGEDGRLALTGTDGGAIGTDYVTIDADRFWIIRLDEGVDRVSSSVFVDSAAAGSVVVQAIAEEG